MNSGLCISVDGGGALGVGPAWYLSRLEQDLGVKVANRTCAFAGTSTGSIIAALLAENYSANDIYNLYRNNLKKIFTKYSWYKRLQPKCPTYDNSNLKKLCKEKLNGKCSDWKKPIFIPATFMNGASEEKVWDNMDNEEKWFAVLTSCSAPTYFDVIVDDKKRSFCDGGMWANCPEDVLLAGMYNRNQKNIRILSLGTGMDRPNTESGNMTLLEWGQYMLSEWIARSGNAATYKSEAILGKENVLRIRPNVKKKYAMDNLDIIDEVKDIWDKEYERTRDQLLRFVNP